MRSVVLTQLELTEIGRRPQLSIDNMILQRFKNRPNYIYVYSTRLVF